MSFAVEEFLSPTEVLWADGEVMWRVVVHWGWVEGRLECTGIGVTQDHGGPVPLTAATLRRLKLGDVVRRARQKRYDEEGGSLLAAYRAAEAGDQENQHLLEVVSPSLIESVAQSVEPFVVRRPGRPKEYDDEHYRSVAHIYSEALAAGLPPLQAVVRKWHASQATASRWVARARELGMLPKTTPGKVGRPATPEQKGDRP